MDTAQICADSGALRRPKHMKRLLLMAVALGLLAIPSHAAASSFVQCPGVGANPNGCQFLVTFNADVNAPMVAVNDRLGFRPVQWMGEVQKTLA